MTYGEQSKQAAVRVSATGVLHQRNDVASKAQRAWIAVDGLTTASPRELRESAMALLEMREKLDAMIARAGL